MKHLVVKANTNATWEGIDVVIVELDEKNVNTILTLQRLTQQFASQKELEGMFFDNITFSFNGQEFKNDDNDRFADLTSFTIVDDLNEDEFSDPETHIDLFEINLNKQGFTLRAQGEYTGDEFFSARVDYIEFANALKK